ncbi:MAG: amino acid--tRNA ligase-related protein [Sphaerochaeta sp.]
MREAALFRSKTYKTIRSFFDERAYLEVDTPILSTTIIPESTIENFGTEFRNPFLPSQELYLLPSPELYMKQLIAEGFGSVYQISHCFRNSEQLGRIHNIEFSMLEYYSVGFDENDSITLTEELFSALGVPELLQPPFRRMSVAEATKIYAGFDLEKTQHQSLLKEEALRLGLNVPTEPESWEETFNRIFLTFVEPNLPQDVPLILSDYPKQIECLAKANGPYRRRWELYGMGMELANCYYEETDEATMSEYYRSEYARLIQNREISGGIIADVDPSLAKTFATMGKVSGVALGLDRLLMGMMGRSSLEGVILFPLSAMITDGTRNL